MIYRKHKKVAITGFCFGGSYSFNLAIHELRLKAAVPFYGHAPMDEAELKKIACPENPGHFTEKKMNA